MVEGVESEEISPYLDIYPCDEAQGHCYARPIPASNFPAWLKSCQASH